MHANLQIEKVSLFRNGAEVVRRGKVQLKQGSQQVIFDNLGSSADSTTARLFSMEGVHCSNIRFEVPAGKEDAEKESDRILKELEDLNRQREICEMQAELWQTNGNFTERKEVSAKEVEEYISLLPERIGGLHKQIKEIDEKEKKLQEELKKAQQKESAPVMFADVTVPEDGEYLLELKVYESQCGWRSVYELHARPKEKLELRHRASIFQRTGADWKNARISLLTGDPTFSGTLPKLNPTYLNVYEKNNLYKNAAAGRGVARMMEAADMMVEEEEAPVMLMKAAVTEAEEISDETMTEFVLENSRDIANNSRDVMADLQVYDLKADYEVIAVPKLDNNAYLIASVNTSELPLLSTTSLAVYLNDVYTGEIVFDADLSEEKTRFTLGREERVHISRKETKHNSSSVFLKGQKVNEISYQTKVTNASNEEVEILLIDQIPVSRNKDVVVDNINIPGAERDEKTGEVRKKMVLKPQESGVFDLGYRISWPKDKSLRESSY